MEGDESRVRSRSASAASSSSSSNTEYEEGSTEDEEEPMTYMTHNDEDEEEEEGDEGEDQGAGAGVDEAGRTEAEDDDDEKKDMSAEISRSSSFSLPEEDDEGGQEEEGGGGAAVEADDSRQQQQQNQDEDEDEDEDESEGEDEGKDDQVATTEEEEKGHTAAATETEEALVDSASESESESDEEKNEDEDKHEAGSGHATATEPNEVDQPPAVHTEESGQPAVEVVITAPEEPAVKQEEEEKQRKESVLEADTNPLQNVASATLGVNLLPTKTVSADDISESTATTDQPLPVRSRSQESDASSANGEKQPKRALMTSAPSAARHNTAPQLNFAYSPRNFGASTIKVPMNAAGSTLAAAVGGLTSPRLKVPSPRDALSSSAPQRTQAATSSPRMVLSPPPALHIPKPLGYSIEPGQEPKVIIVQKAWRGKLARRKLQLMVKHSQARFKVAEELAITEKNYVDILHTIIQVFMEPLTKQLPTWLAEQNKAKKAKGATDALVPNLVEVIFGNTRELYKMHKAFLDSLQYAIKNWYPYCKLGTLFIDVLLRMNGFLVEYGKYVNGYGQAIKYWNQAMRNPSFARFINTSLDNPRCNHLDFCSLIINPVQRVPRYALLLRDIQKHTWAGHGDEQNIAHALDKIHIVAEYVNEAKRAAEGMERTTFLQNHLDDKKIAASLAQPQRKYIREGPLKFISRKELKDRHIILFNDLIVITVIKATQGKAPAPRAPVGTLPTELRVKGSISLAPGMEVKTLDKPERAIQLTVNGKTSRWQAPTAKDCEEWLADLKSLASRPLSHSV